MKNSHSFFIFIANISKIAIPNFIFRLKYNPNYYELDKYDISLDEYIKEDLDEIDRKGTNEQGWKYKLHQELKFKNTLRIIEFMDSIPF